MADNGADQRPPDPKMQALAIRKAEAEVRKLTAEARQAETDAAVPKLPTELPAGTLTTPETASPVGVLAAYRALTKIATTVTADIPAGVERVWIVPDDRPARYRAIHELVTSQLSRFEDALDEAARLLVAAPVRDDQSAFLAPPAVLALAASALPALMSLFKTDTTVRHRDVTMGFTPLAANVATHLRRRGTPHVAVAGLSTSPSDELSGRAATLENERDALARALAAFRAEHVDEPSPDLAAATTCVEALRTILEAEAKKSPPPDLLPHLERMEQAARRLAEVRAGVARSAAAAELVEKVIEAVDGFLTRLRTADATGATPLSVASDYAANADAHVLLLEPSYAGGETIYESIQMKRDRGLHVGVVTVAYALVDSHGQFVTGGTADASQAATTEMGRATISWGGGDAERA